MHRRFVLILSLVSLLMAPLSAQRVRRAVDPHRTVLLPGNRHPLARPELELGEVSPDTQLERMILVLRPDPVQEHALAALLDAQHDPHSPLYHQWLTPQEFAERFGVSRQDLDQVTGWLSAQGFAIDEIPGGGRAVVFSGPAAAVESAFHPALRRYAMGGRLHLANSRDPRIPEALADIVHGIATLHDFRRRTFHHLAAPSPQLSIGGQHYLSPGDFATIYDVAPLYANGIDGTGQSIAIVGRSNIPLADVRGFRQLFGLPANDPAVVVNGPDPGILSSDELTEAELDVQWSGAVAPKANVNFVVSASTNTTDGVDLSAQYIVSHNLAPVMSTSFGSCEAYMGAAERAFYNNLWQQAAAQGITTLIASGDEGAAGCDDPSGAKGTAGQAVNGLCSTPYSVCVGGTEFNDTANPGAYWTPGNTPTWSSATGYIPEVVWNESGANGGSGLWAGGGGASAYYSKPAWQTGPGVPADGRRDVPDVSLSASMHDAYAVNQQGWGLVVVGGTSAATPAFAGVMALVNQQTASRQGNANTTLYALAALQANGGQSYFHDTTSGNNTVPGVAGFSAGTGYDQASGLGSVDAAVLVNHWNDPGTAPVFSLTLTPSAISLAPGGGTSISVTVSGAGASNSPVILKVAGTPPGLSAILSSGNTVLTVSTASYLAGGVYPLQVTATQGNVSQTATLTVTVAAAPCTLASSPSSIAVTAGLTATAQLTCAPVQAGANTPLRIAITGVPAGVAVLVSPVSIVPGSGKTALTVIASSVAAPGNYSLTVTATGAAATASLSIPLTVSSFNLSAGPTSLTLMQGASGQVTVTAAHVAGFNSPVTLSVTGLPGGVTASFSPVTIPAPGDGSSTLSIRAASNATAGTFNLTLKASGGGITRTQSIQLTIHQPPGFALTAGQGTLSVPQGGIGVLKLTISSLVGGFNSAVALSLAPSKGVLPSGLSATFTPPLISAPGAGSSLLTISPNSATPAGIYSLVITATGAGVTRTVSLTLTVTPPPGFTLRSAAPALSAKAGSSTSTQITAAFANGFQSPVTLFTGALPAGVIVTFQPGSIASNGGHTTMNVLTMPVSTPGAYTIAVYGSGGNASATSLVTLKITR